VSECDVAQSTSGLDPPAETSSVMPADRSSPVYFLFRVSGGETQLKSVPLSHLCETSNGTTAAATVSVLSRSRRQGRR
jgi:hypothetical protein